MKAGEASYKGYSTAKAKKGVWLIEDTTVRGRQGHVSKKRLLFAVVYSIYLFLLSLNPRPFVLSFFDIIL